MEIQDISSFFKEIGLDYNSCFENNKDLAEHIEGFRVQANDKLSKVINSDT
tara:strand:- start:421 stop:573 length:153 start_codon:yes stop_codon:yes gene_type:complete